jgi:hypothetical protein
MQSTRTTITRATVVVTAVVAGLAGTATAASAAAPSDGCPAGYTLLDVATLTSAGYRVPAEVDSPTSGISSFGQPGNGDGYVCGVQLGNRLTPWGAPVYNFIDDQLPA